MLRLARIAALVILALTLVELARQAASPGRIDFVAFWAAAKLAVAGDPVAAWDMTAHRAAQGQYGPQAGVLPFANPPPFLLLILPLGALPYLAGLPAWLAATLPAYLAAARPLFEDRRGLWLAAAFPPVLVNAAIGQAAFVTAALFVGGLILAERRPFAAGVLLGALVIKPHLAVLIPFALLAGGRWRMIAGAALSSLCLLLAALLAFGPDAYAGFLDGLPFFARGAAEGQAGWHKMASLYALFRSLGLPAWLAWTGHVLAALAGTAVAVAAWRGKGPARAPLLAAASAMIPPYIYAYDLLILIVSFAWLLRAGFEERLPPWRLALIALLWILPLAQLAVPLALAAAMAPVLLLLLVADRPSPSGSGQ